MARKGGFLFDDRALAGMLADVRRPPRSALAVAAGRLSVRCALVILGCLCLLALSACDDGGGDGHSLLAQTGFPSATPNGAGPRGLRLCNTTSSRVGVAIGYKDSNGWATEGWWNIASHTCETLLRGNLIARYYYIHAIDYDRGGEWAGRSFMCTDDKAFTIRATDDCNKRGFKRTGFFEIDTGEERGWTVRLTDPGEAEVKTQ